MPDQNDTSTTEKPVLNGNGTKAPETKDGVATTTVVVPPDGGWGWVVMFASFMCNVLVDGIVFTSGLFLDHIAAEFDAGEAEVTFVSSLLSGFYLLAGPFVSALANRWGFKAVTIIGACIASFAFVLSYFATGVVYLYFSYGVLGGIGCCFIYMPAVLTVGYYFEKWRALATGISLCGSGVGTFVFAPINQYLLTVFTWKQVILIQAGIILFCIIFAMAFRPIKPIEVTVKDAEEEVKVEHKNPDGLTFVFTKPLPEGRFAYSVPNSAHNTWIGASHNTQYPTAAEVFRGSNANLDRRPSGTTDTITAKNIHSTTKKLEQFSKAQKRTSGQSTPEEVLPQAPPLNVHLELKTVGEDEEENESGALLEDEVKPVIMTARRHTVSGRRPGDPNTQVRSRASSRRESNVDGSRPLYRDDIFFSGSLARISQYQSQTSLAYHMSVTRMPTKHDVEEEADSKCAICPEAVRRTLATMLDVSLLKSPSFMLLAMSGFFTMMGFFVPFIFLVKRAMHNLMEEQEATIIISCIGISNTLARILCGLLSSFKGMNALYINNVAITIGGIATIFSGHLYTKLYQYTYGAIFGIAIACFSALRSILVVDLMGLEKLTNAFGILMMFQGLAATIGAPIAGLFMEYFDSFDAAFWLSGGLITLSAVLCYPLNYVKSWEMRKSEEKLNKIKSLNP